MIFSMSQVQSAFVYISGLTNSPFMRTVIPPTSKARKIQRHTKSPVHPTKCLMPFKYSHAESPVFKKINVKWDREHLERRNDGSKNGQCGLHSM